MNRLFNKRVALIQGLGFLLFFRSAASQNGRPIEAFAGIPPVAGLVERIGGSRVRVQSLLGPGDNPHLFEPTPRQILEISRAELYFSVGFPFERSIVSKLKKLRIVRTESGIPATGHTRSMSAGGGHPPEYDSADDPHVWLSPPLIRIQVKNILLEFETLDPFFASYYRKNYASLLNDLDAAERWMAQRLAPYKGRAFLAYHPAFGRFAEAARLRQMSIETEGKSPSPRQLASILSAAEREGIRVVFVEPQFDSRSAGAVAKAVGGRIETLDPMARDPIQNLKDITEKIAKSLAEKGRRKDGKTDEIR
jgi:zinc transport system substrate-binding protein